MGCHVPSILLPVTEPYDLMGRSSVYFTTRKARLRTPTEANRVVTRKMLRYRHAPVIYY